MRTGSDLASEVIKDPLPYTTQPIMKARLRPSIWPSLPPVIMKAAMTSVYKVMASWIPVTVVPTSLATVAMETFMTELSRVMRNCAAASVSRTTCPPEEGRGTDAPVLVTSALLRSGGVLGGDEGRDPRPRGHVGRDAGI